jgi:hypothetical protein
MRRRRGDTYSADATLPSTRRACAALPGDRRGHARAQRSAANKEKPPIYGGFCWARQDLNLRLTDYESAALTN